MFHLSVDMPWIIDQELSHTEYQKFFPLIVSFKLPKLYLRLNPDLTQIS